MNNLSDEDPQLTNFLRQHRSMAPPDSIELEDRLMAEIELLPTTKTPRISRLALRRIIGSLGILTLGTIGITIHYLMNPPEQNVAELHQLDRYLLAHSHSFVAEPGSIDNADDLDSFLLQDDDSDNM
jgi:hypothetical protein